jgi:hypothetical protein
MQQKEDLVHQSDHPALNPPKWLKKLTMFFTSVLLLTMFGLGGYWLGTMQQQSSPPHFFTKPKASRLPSATPAQGNFVSPTITTEQSGPATDWATYTSTAGGYTIKYPSDKYILCNIQGDTTNFFLYVGGTQTRQCHLGEESSFFTLYIEDTIRDFGTSNYPECYKTQETNTTISGIPAKQYRNIILSGSEACAFPSSYARNFTRIVFPHNDQTFVVAYRENEDIVMKQTILSTLERVWKLWVVLSTIVSKRDSGTRRSGIAGYYPTTCG